MIKKIHRIINLVVLSASITCAYAQNTTTFSTEQQSKTLFPQAGATTQTTTFGSNRLQPSVPKSVPGNWGMDTQLKMPSEQNKNNENSFESKPDLFKSDFELELNSDQNTKKNQFQKFILATTGRYLPIFGQDFFTRSAYKVDTNSPPIENYIIRIGDEIKIQTWGSVDYNATLIVDKSGNISIPRVGSVKVINISSKNIETVLRDRFSKIFTNFDLTASIGNTKSIAIHVVGQTKKPGTYFIPSMSGMLNALFSSGGPSENGSMRKIQLKRAGNVVATLDIYDFLSKGESKIDIPLLSGDVILIPAVGPQIAVNGSSDYASIYELKNNTTIGDIFQIHGNLSALIDRQNISLERITPGKNISRQIQKITLNSQGLNTALRDGDVIQLAEISKAFANAVTLQGNVARPVRSQWFPGMRLRDLIPNRDALITENYYERKNSIPENEKIFQKQTDLNPNQNPASTSDKFSPYNENLSKSINWSYAFIERLDNETLKESIIGFNLDELLKSNNGTQNIELMSGDTVVILNQNDIKLPQEKQNIIVKIEGEVQSPGIYQINPGENLIDLIQRIGGVTAQAYIFGTEFNRVSVKKRQQDNVAALIKKLEGQLQSEVQNLASNKSNDKNGELIALQQQTIKNQIKNIQSFQSTGRMSLELEPSTSNSISLPELRLEDGDRIYIPTIPGFVSAIGAVNNENVFIYKSGKKVFDVLKTAGLSKDADTDQMFLLRADGTILTKEDNSSFFNSSKFESIELMPGDTVVVPVKLDTESKYNVITRVFKDWTQILSNFGLGLAALKTLGTL